MFDLEGGPAHHRRERPVQRAQAGRAVDRQRLLAPAQAERLEQARQPEEVVGVEVADEDLLELEQADRAQELALGALAAVEQQPVAAAPDERGGQAAARRGRGAGGADEDHVEVHGAAGYGQGQSSAISSNDTRPSSTRARPIVCRGWRRRSVGLPGLKIWKPSRLLVERDVRVAEDHRVARRGSAPASARAAPRLGPASCTIAIRAPAAVHGRARAAAAGAAGAASTLPCTPTTGGPIASSSSQHLDRDEVAGVQDQVRRRAAARRRHRAAGGRRAAGACPNDGDEHGCHGFPTGHFHAIHSAHRRP